MGSEAQAWRTDDEGIEAKVRDLWATLKASTLDIRAANARTILGV
jgi:hypothetical protein